MELRIDVTTGEGQRGASYLGLNSSPDGVLPDSWDSDSP